MISNSSRGFEISSLNSSEPFLMTLLRFSDAFMGVLLFTALTFTSDISRETVYKVDLVVFFFIVLFFHFHNIYRSFRFSALRQELYQIFFASLSLYIVLLFVSYVAGLLKVVPRGPVLLWMILWPLSISILRVVVRKFLRMIRAKGYNLKNAVIIGNGEAGLRFMDHIRKNPWSGVNIVGCLAHSNDKNGLAEVFPDIDVIDDLDSMERYVREKEVRIVYFSMERYHKGEIRELCKRFQDIPVSIHYIPDVLFLDMIIGGEVVFFDRWPLIVLRGKPIRGVAGLFKQCFDFVAASLLIVLLFPLFVVISAAVKWTSPGPVFFAQHRYGINGRKIIVYKFRTMRALEQGEEFRQATKNDPRVTKVGAFLRKTSLDELPQLFNVIKGEMSLVGPRPHPVAMDESYRKIVSDYMVRHEVKPGMTGLAQVNGFRGETDTLEKMEKRVEYDVMYIREWSFMLDIELLIRTMLVLLFQKTAY